MKDKHEKSSSSRLRDLLISIIKFLVITGLAFVAIVGIGAVFIDGGTNTQL